MANKWDAIGRPDLDPCRPLSRQQYKDQTARAAFDLTAAEAHAAGVCIRCKRPPELVTDAGVREYRISALCEPCFDRLFAEEGDL